jgi:hypothetical protein
VLLGFTAAIHQDKDEPIRQKATLASRALHSTGRPQQCDSQRPERGLWRGLDLVSSHSIQLLTACKSIHLEWLGQQMDMLWQEFDFELRLGTTRRTCTHQPGMAGPFNKRYLLLSFIISDKTWLDFNFIFISFIHGCHIVRCDINTFSLPNALLQT